MLTFSNCCILLGLTVIPLNSAQIHFLEKTLFRYLVLGIVFIFQMLVLILANIKFKVKGKKTS